MKIVIGLLVLVAYVSASPAEAPFHTPDELDLSKLTPNNIYLEPVNVVNKEVNDLPGGRIIGGSEVTPNSIPYQVAVIINGLSFCGGSLIATNRVLTAAHCTARAVFVQVRLGAHNFNTNEATQVRLTSTSIRNHENYDVGGFAANDVAVILLPSSVVPNAHIQIIPLAPATAGDFVGAIALLSGWGRTSASSNAVSPVLHSVRLPIISNAVCAQSYGNNVLASSICTSGVGTVGACNGDSGGPLVVDGVQVGIVSFGSTNCEAGNPTVYARITSFATWIANNVFS